MSYSKSRLIGFLVFGGAVLAAVGVSMKTMVASTGPLEKTQVRVRKGETVSAADGRIVVTWHDTPSEDRVELSMKLDGQKTKMSTELNRIDVIEERSMGGFSYRFVGILPTRLDMEFWVP